MAISADDVQKYLLERAERVHADDAYILRAASGFIDQFKAQSLKLHESEAWLARRNEEINERDVRLATAESRLEQYELKIRGLFCTLRERDGMHRAAAMRAWEDHGRRNLIGDVEIPATIATAHVHDFKPSALIPGELVCSCGEYYAV